jgi:predicted PurR-regulated permease PerM
VCLKPFSYALRSIPTAVLYGLFLFLAVSSFEGNEFAYRMYMLCMEPRLRLQCTHRYRCASARFDALRRFTALQMVLCGVIFGITFTPAGVVFPVLIAALIAVREFLLPRWFDHDQLVLLDSPILPAAEMKEASEREIELTGVC